MRASPRPLSCDKEHDSADAGPNRHDLSMGQPLEFALQSCVLAVRLGAQIGLTDQELKRNWPDEAEQSDEWPKLE